MRKAISQLSLSGLHPFQVYNLLGPLTPNNTFQNIELVQQTFPGVEVCLAENKLQITNAGTPGIFGEDLKKQALLASKIFVNLKERFIKKDLPVNNERITALIVAAQNNYNAQPIKRNTHNADIRGWDEYYRF